MKRFVFRVDSSFEIGSGHLIRCRSLAYELKNQGAEIFFITKNLEGNLINLINNEFFTYEITSDKNYSAIEKKNYQCNYYKNLKSTQEEDAIKTLEILDSKINKVIDWIVIDHYSIDSTWSDFIKNSKSNYLKTVKFFVIDDLINRSLKADILLNQNFQRENIFQKYKKILSVKSKILIGPKFSLLSKDYAKLHKCAKIRISITNILVYFGGVDKENYTLEVINKLKSFGLKKIKVFIVIGNQNKNKVSIYKSIKYIRNFHIYIQLKSIAELMLESDLYIGSSGTTTVERFCLGLPSMVKAISPDQIEIIKSLENSKLTKSFEFNNFEKILREFFDNKNLLSSMSGLNLSLNDGLGTKRLCLNLLLNFFPLKIRDACISDLQLLYNWVNEKRVRKFSFNKNKISEKEHKNWLQNSLNDMDKYIFIITNPYDLPIAQTRFEKRGEILKIDISIDKEYRGNNLATNILKLAFLEISKKFNSKIYVIAEIKKENEASIKAFKNLKYYEKIFDKKESKFIFKFDLSNKDLLNYLIL